MMTHLPSIREDLSWPPEAGRESEPSFDTKNLMCAPQAAHSFHSSFGIATLSRLLHFRGYE
jgi:hypothetical protein